MSGGHAGQRRRSLPRRVLAALRRHPVRTLRRGEAELVDRLQRGNDEVAERTGLAMGPLVGVTGFTVCVLGYVAWSLWRILL